MKDTKKLSELIRGISLSLLDFDEGDLMYISDLQDQISSILDMIDEECIAKKIINLLFDNLSMFLKGENEVDLLEIMTEGLDLSLRIIQNGESSEIVNKEDIDEFFSRYSIEPGSFDDEDRVSDLVFDDGGSSIEPVKDNTEPVHDISISLDSDTFKIFITELNERIDRSLEILFELENDIDNTEYVNELFRMFHTIKGESGFLKIYKLSAFTHNVENLLDMIRNREIELDKNLISLLFECTDILKNINTGFEKGSLRPLEEIETGDIIDCINKIIKRHRVPIGEILQKDHYLTDSDIDCISNKQKNTGYTKKFGQIAVEEKIIEETLLKEVLDKQSSGLKKIVSKNVDQVIKVKSSQINFLVDMIGELLIDLNQLEDKNIKKLRKTTLQIQNAAMSLRTVKIKSLFINMKRVLRDLAEKMQKEVEVELIGEDLEVDRNLIESLEPVLIHMMRNAVGHGIEDADKRLEIGKNQSGTITLKAERRGNSIIISIKDDGNGLDREKIIKKAIDSGLTTQSKVKLLTDNEIYNFIFTPGFSTADQVDDVSGRGVGMDVVQTSVREMRGKISIESEFGIGTEIKLIYPLSMAIIEGMIIRLGDDLFVVPVSRIIECLEVDPDNVFSVKGEQKVIKLRKEIIPVIDLHYFFGKTQDRDTEHTLAVIVEHNDRKYTFIVDEIVAKKEVVIKSLGSKFKKLQGVSSATVLSGGRVALIISVDDIVRVTGREMIITENVL